MPAGGRAGRLREGLRQVASQDRRSLSGPVGRYALLLSMLFVGFAAFLFAYTRIFALGSFVILFGLAALAASCVAAWLVATLVGNRWPSPHDRICIRILTVALFIVLTVHALLYALAFLTIGLWGDLLDYEIAAASVPALGNFFRFDFLDAGDRLFAQISILAVLVSPIALLAWFSRCLAANAVGSARCWLLRHPKRGPATLARSAALILAALIGCCFWITEESPLAGEPLTAFFKISGALTDIELDAARIAAFEADQASLDAYPFGRPFAKKNVILIFADSMRADHMSVYGYPRPTTPFLSSLQEQGRLHRVDTALSTCSESVCGIASTFASRPLHEISLGNLKLNTLLRREGYRIHYYLAGNHLNWSYLEGFYGPDVDDLHEFSPYEKDILDDRNIIEALAALPPADDDPHFFYFFLMSSHVSGTRIPEYSRFKPDTIPLRGPDGFLKMKRSRPALSDTLRTSLINRYDNGILQADAFIGEIIRRLDERGYLDDSILVILGDHGEGLGEHGNVGHIDLLYQEHIRIPLLVWDNEPGRYRNDTFATQIDVAPTILDRLGLPVPASWRGRSMLAPPADRMTLHQTGRRGHGCAAVVRDSQGGAVAKRMKYVRCDTDGVTEELYDLIADPGERNNLVGSTDRDALQPFRDALKDIVAGNS